MLWHFSRTVLRYSWFLLLAHKVRGSLAKTADNITMLSTCVDLEKGQGPLSHCGKVSSYSFPRKAICEGIFIYLAEYRATGDQWQAIYAHFHYWPGAIRVKMHYKGNYIYSEVCLPLNCLTHLNRRNGPFKVGSSVCDLLLIVVNE